LTKIEWTDQTWNPVTGCTKISAGCKNCYAETIAKRFWGDRKFTDVQCHIDRLNQPLKWRKSRMVFVNSMSDLFHKDVPLEFIERVYGTIFDCSFVGEQYKTPFHTFQILTKRPYRAKQFYESHPLRNFGWNNLWLGVSVSQQGDLHLIDTLLEIPVKVRFVSFEPLLENIIIPWLEILSWVIVGCESGPKRRECKVKWVESIVEQCQAADVPVFVKQLNINGKVVKDINQFPKHLQIREYPEMEDE